MCSSDLEDIICNKCIKEITFCNDEFCVGYYKGILKKLILEFKYKGDFQCGEILARFLKDKIHDKDYCITYIPCSMESYKKRNFDQCEFLVKKLSKQTKLEMVKTLKRVKTVKEQKKLSRGERQKNMIGVFKCINNKKISNKKIILIDDVITTGSTLKEAIKVLKAAGARDIKVLTIARAYI